MSKMVFKFHRILVSFFLLFLMLGMTVPASAQLGQNPDIVKVTPRWSKSGALPGDNVQLALQLDIDKAWHINAHQPLDEYLIPTEVKLNSPEGVSLGRIYYPEPETYEFDFSENPVSVYQGTVHLVTTMSLPADLSLDSVLVTGTLRYQACNNTSCLPPTTVDFSAALPVANSPDMVKETNQEIFTGAVKNISDGSGSSAAQESQIADWLNERGLFLTLILIFLGGLALNLTPCVYPLIPITISYFGGQAKGDNVKNTFVLAIFYVLGMSVTYSVLGTVAALSGQLFGAALQNPLVLGFIALILVVLATSMFGAFEIRVPQSLASVGGKSRQGIIGSLFMGLTVGIIAAPCIGPFVLSLLIFVGDIGNPFMGFLMFFTLSLGLGLPFLLLGTFSGLINKLPRSGAWMVWVRYIFGFVLIGVAIYFLAPLMSTTLYHWLMAINAFAGAAFLGVVTWKKTDTRFFKIAKPVIGLLFLAVGIWMIFPRQTSGEALVWKTYSQAKVEQALQNNQPVIIDFYADWCIPCKELDKYTFTDERVVSGAENFLLLKADLTQSEAEQVKMLKKKYNIRGVPTIVFINRNGTEVSDLRLLGYEPPEDFIQRMERVQS